MTSIKYDDSYDMQTVYMKLSDNQEYNTKYFEGGRIHHNYDKQDKLCSIMIFISREKNE